MALHSLLLFLTISLSLLSTHITAQQPSPSPAAGNPPPATTAPPAGNPPPAATTPPAGNPTPATPPPATPPPPAASPPPAIPPPAAAPAPAASPVSPSPAPSANSPSPAPSTTTKITPAGFLTPAEQPAASATDGSGADGGVSVGFAALAAAFALLL